MQSIDCLMCGEPVLPLARVELGYKVCKGCGDGLAAQARKVWTVAPLHKSNYMLITDRNDLVGLNNKGGLIR